MLMITLNFRRSLPQNWMHVSGPSAHNISAVLTGKPSGSDTTKLKRGMMRSPNGSSFLHKPADNISFWKWAVFKGRRRPMPRSKTCIWTDIRDKCDKLRVDPNNRCCGFPEMKGSGTEIWHKLISGGTHEEDALLKHARAAEFLQHACWPHTRTLPYLVGAVQLEAMHPIWSHCCSSSHARGIGIRNPMLTTIFVVLALEWSK